MRKRGEPTEEPGEAPRMPLGSTVRWLSDYSKRHWTGLLRLRDRFRFTEGTMHLVLAGLVGVLGGFINLAFYLCTESVKLLALRHAGELTEIAEVLGWWQRMASPALGGLAAGLVLHWGLRRMNTPEPNNLLEVVAAGDGRLPPQSALIRVLSSLLSFGTGASIGREGPIVHLSATLASGTGQLIRWPPYRLRLLVACGAAAGMAAAYNAPIAGAVFAAQIVLGSFAMNLFAPLVFASVVATIVTRSFFGIHPWYVVPSFDFTRLAELPWFVLLGGVSGALGAVFLKLLRLSEAACAKSQLPIFVRIGGAGLLVGLIAIQFPLVWGNGYAATNQILLGSLTTASLLGLFVAKLVATVVTVGSGTVGGVFTPTLFLGASAGSLFAMLLHHFGWALGLPTGAFAVVGMGSVLAATTHSPLLAMIMVFEISLNYSLMPPLMLACVLATLVARKLHRETIYTEPLRRRGVSLGPDSDRVGAATQQTVGDFMRERIPPVRDTASFRDVADRFLVSPNNYLPVVNSQDQLVGVVALHDLKEFLNTNQELHGVIAYDLMRPPPPCLTPNQSLIEALPVILTSELRHIPVVNTLGQQRLVGAVARSEVLGVMSEAIADKSLPSA